MGLVRWSEPHQKASDEPRCVSKAKRRTAEWLDLQEAYAVVNARDGSRCWVTGRYAVAGDPDRRVRREHHHLKGRRVEPAWKFKAERIITVCAEAHQLINAGWIVVEGADARKPIFFHWAAHVAHRDKPLVIQRKCVRPEIASHG